ncbi:hypothetical protein FKM82_021986 [Ascaphus truei]
MGSAFSYQIQNTIHSLISSHINIIGSVGPSGLILASFSCRICIPIVAKSQPSATPRTGDTQMQVKTLLKYRSLPFKNESLLVTLSPLKSTGSAAIGF